MSVKSVLSFIRPEILALKKYQSAKDLGGTGDVISLSANENPFCFEAGKQYNRYPDLQDDALLKCLSDLYGIPENYILHSRGSSEMIELIIKLFCRPFTDKAIVCSPTYMMYPKVMELNGIQCVDVPLKDNLQLDVPRLIEQGKKPENKVILIPNPNAPLGHLMNPRDIQEVVEALQDDCYVVVDEAYIEFTQAESLIPLIAQYPNLGILRTLSKYYGLADLRCGCFIGVPEIRDYLFNILSPYAIPKVISRLALKALSPQYRDFYQRAKACIVHERQRLTAALKEMPFIDKVYDSQTNFILITTAYRDELFHFLCAQGIMTRPQEAQVKNSLRVSIGTPQENDCFLTACRQFTPNR